MRKESTGFAGLNPLASPVRADTAVRPYAEDLSLNRHSRFRAKSCRGRLLRLPARHDDRKDNRAGQEACPYEWPSDIRKTSTGFDGLNLFGFPVRTDAAVRPYTEDLSMKSHSKLRAKSCRGRLPRLPARCDDRNAKRAGTEACRYEWPVDERKALTLFRWTESIWFSRTGGHSGPTLHGDSGSEIADCLIRAPPLT